MNYVRNMVIAMICCFGMSNNSAALSSEIIGQSAAGFGNVSQQEVDVLKSFKVSGPMFSAEMNATALVGIQKNEFEVLYKNNEGNVKTRRYLASIKTNGLKFHIAYSCNCIFFVQTDFDFYETNKIIELGSGIDFSVGFPFSIGLTYVPFKNAAGGILIFRPALMLGLPIAISEVTGGTLTPLA